MKGQPKWDCESAPHATLVAAHLFLHNSPPAAGQVSHDTARKAPRGQGAPVMASISALYGDREMAESGLTDPQLPEDKS